MRSKRTKISRKKGYYYFRCNKCKRLFLGDHKTMRRYCHLGDDKLCKGKFERIEEDS